MLGNSSSISISVYDASIARKTAAAFRLYVKTSRCLLNELSCGGLRAVGKVVAVVGSFDGEPKVSSPVHFAFLPQDLLRGFLDKRFSVVALLLCATGHHRRHTPSSNCWLAHFKRV